MFETVGVRSSLRCLSSIVAAWYFYKHFIRPFLSPLRKIPGPSYIPLIGNMVEAMRQGANNNGIRWMQKYGSPIIRFYFLGGEGAVLVGEPALAKQILVSNSKNYRRSPNRVLSGIVPGFLVLLSGDEHHALRRLINPVFSSHTLQGHIPWMERIGRRLVRQWLKVVEDSGSDAMVGAQDSMTRLTLDAICQCGFDYPMNSLGDSQGREVKAFNHILGGLELTWLQVFNLNWLPTASNRCIWADLDIYKSCISRVIESKRDKMAAGDDVCTRDILSQLLLARDEGGRPLSQDSLYAQVGGFLFAGFETTSMTLTWTLLELARRPEVQHKVRQEVTKLMPDKDTPLTPDLVEGLTYLTGVIRESLRHNSPISTIFRRTKTSDWLGGYLVPAGTLVGINLGALHRLPENWPEPHEFKPERFLEPYDKYSFLPFGAGPYMCIGSQFSMTETKITLALILRHFIVSLPPGYQFKVVRKLTIQPSPPLQLVLRTLP